MSSISDHHEQQHLPINNYDEYPPGSLMMLKEGRRSWKSNNELAPNCPRCASSNTKFCYYNNYSLSQPRYFCKGCRRYWTKGGSLRNVPVGGGCRKSRRSKSARGQMERLGLNKYQLIPSPEGSSNASDGATDHGANIDLAAVFAKFLNQDSSFTTTTTDDDDDKVFLTDQEFSSGTTSSASPDMMMTMMPSDTTITSLMGSTGDDQIQMENILFESQQLQPSDLVVDFGYYSSTSFYDDQGLPQLSHADDQNLQELLDDHDHSLMEFEGILGGDQLDNHNNIGRTTTTLSNLDMQNVEQFQDLGPFSIDDHTQFVPNIACEDWSSFDLSGY